jgi:Alginate export
MRLTTQIPLLAVLVAPMAMAQPPPEDPPPPPPPPAATVEPTGEASGDIGQPPPSPAVAEAPPVEESLDVPAPSATPWVPPVTPPPAGTALVESVVDKPKPLKRGGLVFEDVGIDGLSFNPTGQIMLRYRHFEGHDFVAGGNADTIRSRARMGMGVTYDGMIGGFVQVQDVRVFGEERNTLGDFSADGLDMHQAFIRIVPLEELEIRLGRQEIAFENHRLIGTVGWIEQARSFDALRVTFKYDMFKLDGFYAKVADRESPTTNPDGTPFHAADVDVLAGNAHLQPFDELGVGIVTVGDFGRPTGLNRVTTGGLATGKTDFGLAYGAEGYYQHGTADADVTHRAYMAGGYLGYTIPVVTKPFIKGFGEVLSGDTNPADNTVRSFNTLFHTGHKFYGEMDYFLNLPVNTQQRGLVDVGGVAGLAPAKNVKLSLTFHHFRAQAEMDDGLKVFGQELDTIVSYAPWPLFKIDWFYGLFAPGDIFTNGVANTKLEHFIYSTFDFGF